MSTYDSNYFEDYVRRYRTNLHDLRRVAKILKITDAKEDASVLDMGCGVGAYIDALEDRKKIRSIVGIDFSIDALSFGKSQYGLKKLVCGDISALPFEGKRFDLVYLIEVVEHIEEQNQLFSEINRVLRDEGVLIITTSPISSYILFPVVQKIRDKPWLHTIIKPYDIEGDKHVAIQHPRVLIANLRSSGFEIERQIYWNAFHLSYFLAKTNIPRLRRLFTVSRIIDGILGSKYLCNDMIIVAKKSND